MIHYIMYQFVQMVMFDLLVAPLLTRDVLSSAITMPGVLSVMTFGAYRMLMLYADNLDTLTRVNFTSITIGGNIIQHCVQVLPQEVLVRELVPFYWIMWGVQELNLVCFSAPIEALESMIVATRKMQELYAYQVVRVYV